LLIDRCISNEKHVAEIISNLEAVLGVYQENAMEHTIEIADALQTAQLFQIVVERTTEKVRFA